MVLSTSMIFKQSYKEFSST